MAGGEIANFLRPWGAIMLLLWGAPAVAQPSFSPSSGAPGSGRSQVCLRLESQLAGIDRGGASLDPARAEQVKRYEDAAAQQQAELDRVSQQSRRMGCQGSGFFALFSGQSPQCGPLNNQIQHIRGNLDRALIELQRLEGNSGEREAQRRSVLIALGQNDCGPQYRQYAHSGGVGGFFENLFGGNLGAALDTSTGGTYRTLCVRTCDGYYFPISYSTVPNQFGHDERLCQRLCPATETVLYSHRNPGEDMARAVSGSGRLYSDLPTAFSYRKQYNAACSCRLPGQSWAEALRQADDRTIERGDIVVTEERAKQLSQPRDPQGRPISLGPHAARPAPASAHVTAAPLAPASPAAPAPPLEQKVEEDRNKSKVRAVGPTFYPVR